MKQLIVIILLLIIVVCSIVIACGNGEKYEVVYKIYWPSNPKTYTVTMDNKPFVGSDRGTNYLKVGYLTGPTIVNTSAPIEVVSYTKRY